MAKMINLNYISQQPKLLNVVKNNQVGTQFHITLVPVAVRHLWVSFLLFETHSGKIPVSLLIYASHNPTNFVYIICYPKWVDNTNSYRRIL
ncbi:hypothetical protein CN335_32305 [Bacillus thuringiensis]|nr:hypothetical protein BK762_37030 [Bacillus thuringiensis serovar toumanoffi]PFF23172.1 hypothetical protein CN335_32305 [Bacillus thuringiensis]PFT03481.1 hypothetical protein COK83_32310 [Bacillus thuringiensis]RFB50956.1 hypothetical protein DZB90_32970 [Bacillus thuringiensis]